jgi:hypothetical protein
METLLNYQKEHSEFIEKLNNASKDNLIFNSSGDNIISKLSPSFVRSLELYDQLINIHPEKIQINDINKLSVILIDFFNKFKNTYGSSKLDDSEWSLYTCDSDKYELDKDTLIFDNSICPIHQYDSDTFNYVSSLVNYIRKLSDNIKADFKYIMDNDNYIINIIIICKIIDS